MMMIIGVAVPTLLGGGGWVVGGMIAPGEVREAGRAGNARRPPAEAGLKNLDRSQ